MTPIQVLKLTVAPALNRLGLHTPQAEQLIMGTGAVESDFLFVRQSPAGPARGYFQMEAATLDDLRTRFLAEKKHAALKAATESLAKSLPLTAEELVTNPELAAALAMVKYLSIHRPVPTDQVDHAEFWSRYYNGRSPHGLKPADYRAAWARLCAPLYPAAA